jgi:hypothetical protein
MSHRSFSRGASLLAHVAAVVRDAPDEAAEQALSRTPNRQHVAQPLRLAMTEKLLKRTLIRSSQ